MVRYMDKIEIIELEDINREDALKIMIVELENEIKNSKNIISRNIKQEERQFSIILDNVINNTIGKAMLLNDKLVGFLAFFGPKDDFFGNCKGAFSPLGYSAFSSSNREKIASILIEYCIEELYKNGITHMALSRYANDDEVGRILNLSSFGMRCSDAIMLVENYKYESDNKGNKAIRFELLNGKRRLEIQELDQALTKHLLASPCCFISKDTDLEALVCDNEKEVIAAYIENDIAGYMTLTHGGETYLSEYDNVRSICGCYVKPEFRHMGIAKALLDEVVAHVTKQGYTYLGTDYETINPTALRFWTKYFAPYTYSYIRRLDERILERFVPDTRKISY